MGIVGVCLKAHTTFADGGKATEDEIRTLAAVLYFALGVVGMAKLTPKQAQFVDEYLVDLNATAAAIRAGYSEKTARFIGAENLTKPNVSAEIAQRRARLRSKLEISQEAVLQELASIAFANGTDFVTVTGAGLLCVRPTSEVPKNRLPAIAGIKYGAQTGIEIKLHDKVRALELLGKHLGVFATGGSPAAAGENNIFEVIEQSTRGEIDTNGIPEIEPPAEPGDDVVE